MAASAPAPVDNSWASVQIALINEKTGEEVYANKDIEYYHGYTDGESWSEGSNTEEFNLCGVSAGKYHLAISSSKDTADLNATYVAIKANWNAPSNRNVWFICILMGVITLGLFYLDRNFEIKRWSDSSYTPYDSE